METEIRAEDFEEIRPLQKKMLEILKYFDQFCRKYEIEYYIHSGTTLGAVRHKGFIPWDDDVDVILTQKNYDKFISLFPLYGDIEKFHLQIYFKKTKYSIFAKLRANGTTFIEENVKNCKIHQGIFLDIFTLQTLPNNKYKRYWQYWMAKFVVAQEYAHKNNPPRGNVWLDRALVVLSKLPRFFCTKFALRQLLRYEGEDSEYFSRFTDGGSYWGGLIKKSTMGIPMDIVFEDTVVMGPQHPEGFLEKAYGDWRRMPNMESIKQHFHNTFFDATRDFREYLPIEELEDEKYL